MFDLCGHELDAVVLVVVLPDHFTPLAANDFELARGLMRREVFLEHFLLTAEVTALDRGEVALALVFLEVSVAHDLFAALFRVFARSLEQGELAGEERMRIDQSQRRGTAVWALNFVVASNQLVDVVVNALLAEALAALVALPRIDHHVLAQYAVQKSIVLSLRGGCRGNLCDLRPRQRGLPA